MALDYDSWLMRGAGGPEDEVECDCEKPNCPLCHPEVIADRLAERAEEP